MTFLAVLRDLLRYNPQFALGAVLTAIVTVMAALSAVSPYNPLDTYMVALDAPPSWQHPFGTTSRGQDVFWLLTFAMRNTLLFGITVAILSRIISLVVGLAAGYLGGWTDRVLMSINDTFIVIPLFPLLVLFYFGWQEFAHSWAIGETSDASPWRPIVWPFKGVIPLTALLLLLQGVGEFLKSVYAIKTGRLWEKREVLEIG